MRRIDTCEEGQSRGRVREIYTEIEHDFGSPYVGEVFRALASYDADVFDRIWTELKPNVETQAFIDLSGQLRQRINALAEVTFEPIDFYSWLLDHDFSREDIRRIMYTLEVLHYVNPKYLLATAALLTTVMRVRDPRIIRRRASEITAFEPDFPTRIPQVMPEQASDDVKEDYYDIADVMGIPVIPDDFQALAHWPDFLRQVWTEFRSAMRSSTFLDEAQMVSTFAVSAAQELPYTMKLDVDQEVRRILETFLSIYARVSVVTAAIRWMVIEGERTVRIVGRAAGERPSE